MGETKTESDRAGNGGCPSLIGRLPVWRRWDVRGLETASLLGLLVSIQLYGAVLAPTVFMWEGRFNNDVGLTMFGAVSAASTLLALWAVFGPQRVAVRLPLTAWLMWAFAECFEYGAVLEHGPNDPGNIAAGLALLLAFFVMQLLLWPLRALGLWRLENSANVPAWASMKPASQFTVRGLLGWTLAVASLLGARRWCVPGGSFESNEWLDLMLRACAATLLMALVGLLVAALGWLLLADGRRPALRTGLCMLTLIGLAAGHWAFTNFGGFDEGAAYLGVGAVANALLSLAVVWACGYRLTRRPSGWSGETTSAARIPIGGPRFALALAALLMPALTMAWHVPAFREHWRLVASSIDWQERGMWASKFDEVGEVTNLVSLGGASISDDTLRRIAQLASLKSVRLHHLQIDDRQLALLAPLARRGFKFWISPVRTSPTPALSFSVDLIGWKAWI